MPSDMPKAPKEHRITRDEIKVGTGPGKGLGLIATADLPRNSRLPYHGALIDQKTYDNFERRNKRHPEKKYIDYIMNTSLPGQYVDAHPRRLNSEEFFGSRVNEPGPGETANMIIRYEKHWPVLVSVKKITAGQELLLHYGPSYDRLYKVGRRATKPAWLR